MMTNMVVIREEQDRFGRVRRSQLRYEVEFDPSRGVYSHRLLPRPGLCAEWSPSRVAALGGGTGLPVVLTALRRHLPSACRITGVVTAADDGGSSGLLREQYGVLPPGDIRNCLVALAGRAPEVVEALQYRLGGSDGTPHPVGNLLLTALGKVAGDDVTAIRLAASLLGVEDVILPSTTSRVHLLAELTDGRCVRGESTIPRSGSPIARLRLDPPDVAPAPGVGAAIQTADMVILGPGSLYTSVLATLIVPGVAEAIKTTSAARIYVCNLMTEPGETDGYGVAAHMAALEAHGLPASSIDYVIVNTCPIPEEIRTRYALDGAEPVKCDYTPASNRPLAVLADVLDPGSVIRHAPDKLGPILCELAAGHRDWLEAAG